MRAGSGKTSLLSAALGLMQQLEGPEGDLRGKVRGLRIQKSGPLCTSRKTKDHVHGLPQHSLPVNEAGIHRQVYPLAASGVRPAAWTHPEL